MKSVFVDASAWVAVINRRDQYHQVASTVYQQLLKEKMLMISSSWTVYEALSITKTRIGIEQAERLWKLVNDPEITQFVPVDLEIEAAALDLFFRYRDKDWGVVDCSSLIIMNRLGCRMAFAFDEHFREAAKQYGFELLSEARE
jgi:hypothetical protein